MNRSDTPEYNSWRGMIERCGYTKHDKFKHYGALGVKVCKEWRESSAAFMEYMGPKPSPGHSLDRFPNPAGNYEPGNVRWATQREQCRNKRDNAKYTAFGKTLCMIEWAEEVGMSVQTLSWRLFYKKLPIEKALAPVKTLKQYPRIPHQP